MNDFDYDNLQRKRLANNARYKKNGSKSRKCSLPQDNMTPAQLKRRNGEVNTYNITKPMQWETFRAMPDDLKREHIKHLRHTYNASISKIAEALHKSRAKVVEEIQRLGMMEGDGVRRQMSKEQEEMWAEFLNPTPMMVELDPIETVVPVAPVEEKHNEELAIAILEKLAKKDVAPATISSGRLNFVGNIESIAAKLTAFLGEGEYSVIVDFRAVSEKEETDELF